MPRSGGSGAGAIRETIVMEDTLRTLIRRIASNDPAIGELEESRKWGQPSFTPKKANVGSSVRIQHNKDGSHSLMFICNTNLVQRFRELYGDELHLIGNREIVIREGDVESDALAHCIAMALTYKLDSR